MLKLNKLFFLILAWKLSLFLLFHTTLFLIGLITRFPFTSGLILIWLTFITLIGVSVLARIINKHSYILLSIFMYYLMYLYYAVSCSKNSQGELLEQLFSNAAFLTSGWYNVMSSFKKSALKTLTYLINNHFITLTLILVFIYIDVYYHSENKLSLILYNQVKGNDYTWWNPCDWWEL